MRNFDLKWIICFFKTYFALFGKGLHLFINLLGCPDKISQTGLNNRNLFSYISRGWQSEVRVPEWMVSGESCLPGLQTAASPCVLTWPRNSKLPLVFFYEDINAVNESTILMASSNLHYLQKNPSPDTSMLLVRASTCGFEGHNSVRSCIYSRKCGKYR